MIRIFMVGFSTNKGGVESYIVNLTEQLDSSEFEVILEMPEMIIDGKTWKRPANRHNFIKYYMFWKQFFSENHFDVLYLNTCDIVSIDDLIFAKSAGIPVRIIHSHSTGNQQEIERRMNLFHRLSEYYSRKVLDQYATHMLACSETAGAWMFNGRPFTVIKNGISLPKYSYSEKSRKKIRSKLGIQNEKLIGIIGRISPQKNPLFAIEILKKVLMEHRNYNAAFVGDGELRSETENAIKVAGLKNRVYFAGAVDNVNEWLSAVDCLLMPSLFEGLPFVLVEAQAAGLPCVVSSSVSEEANISGYLQYVSLDDPLDSWMESVIYAAQSPRYNAEKKIIDAGYSIEDSVREVTELIKNA